MDWSAVNLEYRIYSLDRAAALEILATMPDLQTPWKKLQGLLTEKKARFEHLVSVQTKSEVRVMSREVEEVIFASQYENADLPTVPKDDLKAASTASATVTRAISDAEAVPLTPKEFTMNKAGVLVEVSPTVGSDGLSIDLDEDVSSVIYLADLKVTGVRARYPAQPLFESRKINTC